MMRLRTLAPLLLLATSLHAQHREAITVEVVNVPVYVHRSGQPVEGLTRDNFELFVNGKRQNIDYFDVIGDDAAPVPQDAPQTAAAPLRERRLFLFVFDNAFSRPYLINRARKAAQQMIAEAKAGDYFAVGTYAPRQGVQFLVPFTTDVTAVQVAVSGMATGSNDPLRLVVSRGARASMMAQLPGETAAQFPQDASQRPSTADDEGVPEEERVGEQRADTNERHRELNVQATRPLIDEQLATLAELAKRLSTLEGQKHVVLLSEGFDASAYDDLKRRSSALGGFTAPALARRVEDMAKRFHEAGIFLHTLEVSGLVKQTPARRQESLQFLASSTGGDYLHDRNDLGAALGEIATTYSRGYLLGFRPTGARSGYNNITVRLKGARGKLRHRVGFMGTAPQANPIDALHLADIVLNDVPQTGVPAALAMREGRLVARIPLEQLAAVLGRPGQAELMVYIFDANGAAIDFRRQLIDVPAGAKGELPVTLVLGLPPGSYSVKALLRAAQSVGFSRVKLNVNAPG